MKKVIIIDATGSLAHYVIEALKDLNGWALTLVVRNKSRLSKSTAEACTVMEGDAMHAGDGKPLNLHQHQNTAMIPAEQILK